MIQDNVQACMVGSDEAGKVTLGGTTIALALCNSKYPKGLREMVRRFNNFPRALAEIHRLRDMLIAQRQDAGWPIDDLEYDNKLIKELETVT